MFLNIHPYTYYTVWVNKGYVQTSTAQLTKKRKILDFHNMIIVAKGIPDNRAT